MTTSNESAMTIPRPTTPILSQKKLLLKCLEKRPWLVLLSCRSLDNLECARIAWREIGKELNLCSNGVYKSGEEWAKENNNLLQKTKEENKKTGDSGHSYSLTSLDQKILKTEGIVHFPNANKSPMLSLTNDNETSKEPADNETYLPAQPNHCYSESRSSVMKEKRVLGPTLLQQEMLVQCLEENTWLVKTKNPLCANSKAAWQKIAKKLNYHRNGVFKSWSKWAQYWIRRKHYVKRRTQLIEKDTRINGSAEDSGFLTSLDKRILKLIRVVGNRRTKLSMQHNSAIKESKAKVQIRPTSAQQEMLVECLEEKPWLVQAKHPMTADSKAAWQEIANKLNRLRNGAVRSWSQWALYGVRKTQYVKHVRTRRSAGDSDFLTSLDKRILKLIRVGEDPELSIQHYVSRAKPPTLQQQEMLVECLEERPWLVQTKRQPKMRNSWSAAWQEIAKKLNHHTNGAVKSWEKWVEYLGQRKTYVRKKCLITQRNRIDGAEDSVLFTSVDQRILKLVNADHLLVGNTGPDLSLEHNAIKELRPTKKQKDMLLECLKERPWLPKVRRHSASSRIRANAAWQEIAKKLNSHRIGVCKSWKQWEMHWNFKKVRVRHKLRLIKENQTGERKDSKYHVCLTETDQQVLKMMGVEHFPVGNAGPELSLQAELSHNSDGSQSSEDNPKVDEAISQPNISDTILETEVDGPLLESEDDQDLLEPESEESPLQPRNDDNLLQSEIDEALLLPEHADPLLQSEDDDPLMQNEDDYPLMQNEDDDPLIQNEDDNPLIQNEDDDPLVQNKDDTLTHSKNESLIENEDDDSSIQNVGDETLLRPENDEAEGNIDEQRLERARPTRRDPGSYATPPRRRRVLGRKRRPLLAALAERFLAIEERRADNEAQMMHVLRGMSDAWLQQNRAIQDLASTLLRRHH